MSTSSVPDTTVPSTFDTSKIRDIDGVRRDNDTTEPTEKKGRSLRHPFRSSKPSKRDTTIDSGELEVVCRDWRGETDEIGIGTDLDDGSETVQSDSDESSEDRRSLGRKIKDKLRRKSKDTTGKSIPYVQFVDEAERWRYRKHSTK